MMKRRGLAFKLSVYLLTAVLCILFALLYYNYIISRNLALDDAKRDAKKLTELTVARIENQLNTIKNIPTNLAMIIENRDTIMFVGTRTVIENILKKNPLIYGASIASKPRIQESDTFYQAPYIYAPTPDTLMMKDLTSDEYRYFDQGWYVNARDLGKGIWSEPYYDEGGGEILMATYSVPFYKDYGHGRVFAGVVTADISLNNLQDLIREIQFYKSGKGFLISSQGNIVSMPGIDTLNDKIVHNVFEEAPTAALEQVFNKMINREKGIIDMKSLGGQINNDKWISYAPVPTASWALAIMFSEDELYEGIHNLFIWLIVIGLAGFLIMSVLIFIIARRFVRPLEILASVTRKIGAGELNYNIPSFSSNDEVSQLGESFRYMQIELKEYIKNLKETTAQKEKMESELLIASNIQQEMLPRGQEVPGREGIRFFGTLIPARQVGGDLYDFMVRGKYFYFAVGDVSGKGIPAALFMAKTLTLFRAKASLDRSPSIIAAEINHELELYNSESMFVTFFVGKLDMEKGEMDYCNAGHNPPYMINAKREVIELAGVHGLPLGSLPDQEYGYASYKFLIGEEIVLYTDGITEAVNNEKALYGEERLKNLFSENNANTPRELVELIIEDVDLFADGAEQADDITLFNLKYYK